MVREAVGVGSTPRTARTPSTPMILAPLPYPMIPCGVPLPYPREHQQETKDGD